jgi:hypothetical protein
MFLFLLLGFMLTAAWAVEPPVVLENVKIVKVHDTDPGYGDAPDSYIHKIRVDCTVRNSRGVNQSSVRVACRYITKEGKLYYEEIRDVGVLKAREAVPLQFLLQNPAGDDAIFRYLDVKVVVISPKYP